MAADAAPLHLMTLFLDAVSNERFEEGLRLADQILAVEPDNSLIKSYRPVLLQMRALRQEEKLADDSDDDSEGTAPDDGHDSSSSAEGSEAEAGAEEESDDEEEDTSNDGDEEDVAARLQKLRVGK